MFEVEVIPQQPLILFSDDRFNTGRCQLWIPEGFATVRGFSSIYPHHVDWQQEDSTYTQQAGVESAFTSGSNFVEVEPGVLECAGVRSLKEKPVRWSTRLVFGEDRVDFSITVKNPNDTPLEKVAAALCFKFLEGDWWSDDTAFLLTSDGIKSISDLGRMGGAYNGFQAWLVDDESYDNPFYTDFWGFNSVRVTKPVWVSRCEEAGCSIVVACDAAYFIHSNPGNPCTDLAMKFGDLEPGTERTCAGYVEMTVRGVDDILQRV